MFHLVKDDAEKAKTRKALLEYCILDTVAMVMLLEKLRDVIKKGVGIFQCQMSITLRA